MSFKREGDDENLLKNLNHQRVRELLSSHIPQDEAKLLSNGRLSCTICLYRPVFDTINMLSIHRQGKRHLSELSKFLKCKEDAAMRALRKRPPPNDVKEPFSLKNISKHGRRPILEIQPMRSTKVPVLPCPHQPDGKSASARVRHYLKSMSRKSSLHKVVEKNRENYGVDLQKVQECNDYNSRSGQTVEHCICPSDSQFTKQDTESQDYEMKLRMSGWIKDLTGTWIKDPNVEFDSDEDDIPPPP